MAAASRDDEPGIEPVFDVVHARILRYFPELVADLGGDLLALLHKSGVNPDILSDADARISYRETVNLVEAAAADLACPDFGMRLAKLQKGDMFGPVGLAMKNSRTFGDALDFVSTHSYAHSLAARVWLTPYPKQKAVFVGHDILLDRVSGKAQTMEQILLLGHLGAIEMTGGHARARRVHFRHQPISPLRTYRRAFGCEVFFGQNEDGIAFLERDLASPVVSSDAEALAAVTAFIDQNFTRHHPPLHAQARGIIMRFLWSGRCTNARVAADLKLHPRTLHRRLQDEGTSFQHIKDEVRRDIMLYYLQETDVDLTRISEKLGFAEQSVMTRSCNQWFGASPSRLRANRRKA